MWRGNIIPSNRQLKSPGSHVHVLSVVWGEVMYMCWVWFGGKSCTCVECGLGGSHVHVLSVVWGEVMYMCWVWFGGKCVVTWSMHRNSVVTWSTYRNSVHCSVHIIHVCIWIVCLYTVLCCWQAALLRSYYTCIISNGSIPACNHCNGCIRGRQR